MLTHFVTLFITNKLMIYLIFLLDVNAKFKKKTKL